MTWDSICNYWHSPYFTFVIFCLWSILLCAPNNLLGDIKTDQRKACLGGGNATELTFRNVWSTEDSLGLGQPASRAALMHSLNVFILCLCECVFLYAVYQTKIEDLRKGRHIALHWMCITGASTAAQCLTVLWQSSDSVDTLHFFAHDKHRRRLFQGHSGRAQLWTMDSGAKAESFAHSRKNYPGNPHSKSDPFITGRRKVNE